MSHTTIPKKVRWEIWLKAGGRCQYPGCNKPLWKDELTLRDMNRAYLAHIVADKPGGPRGHPDWSEKLAKDFSNIMLLCDVHHRLIDREDVEGHPADLLRKYKRKHEERIERQTSIQANRQTHILMFGTQIRDRRGQISYDQARQAVHPERYPATNTGISLDLGSTGIDEADPEYWLHTRKFIKRRVSPLLQHGEGPLGKRIEHLSVFALAPIPALIYFGKCLGDIISADIYQRQRSTSNWCWSEPGGLKIEYELDRPYDLESQLDNSSSASTDQHGEKEIVVNISLSGTIHDSEIQRALGQSLPTYVISISEPRRDFLRTKEDLERFRDVWQRLLAEIRGRYGPRCRIHLFAAVPCSVAVEIGRTLLPKSDPSIEVYDHDKDQSGFYHALTV